MPVLIVVLVVAAIVALMVIGTYNRLVVLRQGANNALADMDVQLKHRQDLIPNLVEIVKGYAACERGTLDEVIAARGAAASATSIEGKVAAENALSGALGRLFAVVETYPNLKANQNFVQLQAELGDIENKLAAARRYFNNAVSEYNAQVQSFPAVLFAFTIGFVQRDFFDLGEGRVAAQTAPQVKFLEGSAAKWERV